jgi:hypothetical protein
MILVLPLKKAFSDSARKAALEARRAKARNALSAGGAGPQGGSHGGASLSTTPSPAKEESPVTGRITDARVTEDTPDSTKVEKTLEVTARIKPPPTDGIRLVGGRGSDQETALDYNSILLREKYGEKRGEEMYHGMIDKPGSDRGLHFVVANKIQMEKKAMMRDLGKRGHPDNHHYQGLYKLWSEKQTPKNPPRAGGPVAQERARWRKEGQDAKKILDSLKTKKG